VSTKTALGYLLAFVPTADRDAALWDVKLDLEADGDHDGVQACAALLHERRMARKSAPPAAVSTTWTDGEGEG